MIEKLELELDENMSCVLFVRDSGEYECDCKLERWYSEMQGEWYTGVSVLKGGKEIMHSGMTQLPMTRKAALEAIKSANMVLNELAKGE